MYYTLNELSQMTGYSTRRLRTFLKEGTLQGSCEGRKWLFSEKDLEQFFSKGYVMDGIPIKTNMQVQHFLEETNKSEPKTCVIHDEPGEETAEELNRRMLAVINEKAYEGLTYNYYFDKRTNQGRFVLCAPFEAIAELMEELR